MKTTNSDLKNSTIPPPEKPWQGFSYQKCIRGAHRVSSSSYQVNGDSSYDQQVFIANCPDIIRTSSEIVAQIAKLENQLEKLLKLPPLNTSQSMPQYWIEWLREFKNLNNNLLANNIYIQWPPLIDSFLFEPTTNETIKNVFLYRNEIKNLTEASLRQKNFENLHDHFHDITKMKKRSSDRSNYETLKAKRFKKHQKRRQNLYQKLRPILNEISNLVVIHIVFETRVPFNSNTSTKDVNGKSFLNQYFVNAFLSLRKNQTIAKGAFKGLIGYIRKLELINDYAASGGYITLLYDSDKMKDQPDIVGKRLVNLLCEMSPDDCKQEYIQMRYVFRTNNWPQKMSRVKTLSELMSTVQYYLYSDYFLSPTLAVKHNTTQELLKEQPDLKKLRAFQSGF